MDKTLEIAKGCTRLTKIKNNDVTVVPYMEKEKSSECSFPCLFTQWSRVFLEEVTALQLIKKFPAFYGIRKFITVLTSTRHLSLSWATQPSPHNPFPLPGDPS
jgi:hypothetical protein